LEALDALDQCRRSRNASYGLRWQHHNETVAATRPLVKDQMALPLPVRDHAAAARHHPTCDPDLVILLSGQGRRQGSREIGLPLVYRTIHQCRGRSSLAPQCPPVSALEAPGSPRRGAGLRHRLRARPSARRLAATVVGGWAVAAPMRASTTATRRGESPPGQFVSGGVRSAACARPAKQRWGSRPVRRRRPARAHTGPIGLIAQAKFLHETPDGSRQCGRRSGSRWAISGFGKPSAARGSTSRSRAVRLRSVGAHPGHPSPRRSGDTRTVPGRRTSGCRRYPPACNRRGRAGRGNRTEAARTGEPLATADRNAEAAPTIANTTRITTVASIRRLRTCTGAAQYRKSLSGTARSSG